MLGGASFQWKCDEALKWVFVVARDEFIGCASQAAVERLAVRRQLEFSK
jgi:hypothetical protein